MHFATDLGWCPLFRFGVSSDVFHRDSFACLFTFFYTSRARKTWNSDLLGAATKRALAERRRETTDDFEEMDQGDWIMAETENGMLPESHGRRRSLVPLKGVNRFSTFFYLLQTSSTFFNLLQSSILFNLLQPFSNFLNLFLQW